MCSVDEGNVFSFEANVFSFWPDVFTFRLNVFTFEGQVFSIRRNAAPSRSPFDRLFGSLRAGLRGRRDDGDVSTLLGQCVQFWA